MADEFVVASRLGERLDDPDLSLTNVEACVREIVDGLDRARRVKNDTERAMLKRHWVALLGRAARRTPLALEPLAALLADPDAWDAGGYDPWWESVAEHARDALKDIGAPAVPVLIAALERGSPAARVHAASALEHIGPAAELARASLERAVCDPEERLRIAAGAALGALVTRQDERLALVQRLLAEPKSRLGALVLAWKLTDPRPLFESFCALLDDPDPAVRRVAANHLQMMKRDADTAAATLLDRFERETDPDVRFQILSALEDVGTTDVASTERLFDLVMRNPDVAYRALLALSKRDPALLEPFILPLLRRFHDRGDPLGTEIAIFFRGLGETAPAEVVTALTARLDALGPDDERAANLILFALEDIGRASPSAIAAVERATRHGRSGVRDNAQRILERLHEARG